MNGKLLGILFAVALGSFRSVSAEVEILTRNEDRITGKSSALQKDSWIVQPYWVDHPLRLPFDQVKSFRQLDVPEPESGRMRVRFPSGEALQLLSLDYDGNQFLADFGWGPVVLPRSAAQRNDFLDPLGLRYDGPRLTDPESGREFRTPVILPAPNRQWTAQNLALPEKFLLEIEMILPEQGDFSYQIGLIDGRRLEQGNLLLEMSQDRSAMLWFLNQNPQPTKIQNLPELLDPENRFQEIQIYADLPGKKLICFLNGEPLHEFSGAEVGPLSVEQPAALNFRYGAGRGALVINRLRVLPWSGESPGTVTSRLQDLLQLKDGRVRTGTLRALNAESVKFESLETNSVETYKVSELYALRPGSLPSDIPVTANPLKNPGTLLLRGNSRPLRVSFGGLKEGMLPVGIGEGAAFFQLPVPVGNIQWLRREIPEISPRTGTRLILLNGDRITGIYSGQQREKVLFRMENQDSPLSIHGKYIHTLDFGPAALPDPGGWRVELSEDQFFHAESFMADAETVTFQTQWAESLRIDKAYLKMIQKNPEPEEVVYHGPVDPEKWFWAVDKRFDAPDPTRPFLPTSDGWLLRKPGRAYTMLPRTNKNFSCRVRLKIAGNVDERSAALSVYGVSRQNLFAHGGIGDFQVRISGDDLLLIRDIRRGRIDWGEGGKGVWNEFDAQSVEMDLTFAYDFSRQKLRVESAGRLMEEWSFPHYPETGDAISLILGVESQNADSKLYVQEILLSHHNIPLVNDLEPLASGSSGRVYFANQDFLEVDWSGTDAEGKWELELLQAGEKTKMDSGRISAWIQAVEDRKDILRKSAHIRIQMSAGTENFVAEMLDGTGDSLTVKREGWEGTRKIPLSEVEKIYFNPYRFQ